jgi:two-component system OmpR family response regulator
MSMRVLVVEDDREAARYMLKGLGECGHVADHATDGDQGFALAARGGYDALVVDRMLPKLDGLALVERLRDGGDDTPVLFLSALGKVDDRVRGLKAGGDDYLVKPYAFAELLARLEALVRRRNPAQVQEKLRVADLEVDLLSRDVTRAGRPVELQPREFRLLECLMRNAGRVMTRTMLLEQVWDYHFDPQTNVIEVHISRLRSKIDKGFDGQLLHTVRGAGYCIRAPR